VLLTVSNQLRTLRFSVDDENAQCIDGVLVRFVVDNKVKAEATTTCEKPLEFSIDTKVDTVDIEMFFGKVHEWVKVPMDSGSYTHTLNVRINAMKNPTVIAASITALVALIVGYWQFIYKPHNVPPRPQTVQLRIAVNNLSDHHPVAYAQVEIEDGSRNYSQTTDNVGLTGIVSLDKTGPSTVTITVNAPSFEMTTRNLDRPIDNETANVALKGLSEYAQNGHHSSNSNFKLAGTWDIEPPSDPNNALIKNGSFSFVPQSNGSVSVTANFAAEGVTVQLYGTCGVTGRVVHMSFNATSSQSGTWSGTGDLLFQPPGTMTGRIQSKRGDDVPLVLSRGASGYLIQGSSPVIATAPDTHSYMQPGIRVNTPNADNNNPENRDADRKSREDNAAFQYHLDNESIDSPPEVSIGTDTDDHNYLHYKYYSKTDKCVYLIRREGGADHTQWVKDPLYHNHDNTQTARLGSSADSGIPQTSSNFFDVITPAYAQVQPNGPQFCVNPHPHNNDFATWWGTPIDNCNTGFFRKFRDGCTHYQVYNRCANSWDERIFWTYCHPAPHY
jgi:hypothetical protein